MTRDRILKIAVFAMFVGIIVAARLVPHRWNVTPVAAIALFAGFWFARRSVALAVPLLGMAISDLFLGIDTLGVTLAVYAAFAVPMLVGQRLKTRLTAMHVALSSVTCSVVFFLATNLAVWGFTPWYQKTAAGLATCFTLAVPFFRNTFAGNLAFAAVLFGGYALLARRVAAKPAPAMTALESR